MTLANHVEDKEKGGSVNGRNCRWFGIVGLIEIVGFVRGFAGI